MQGTNKQRQFEENEEELEDLKPSRRRNREETQRSKRHATPQIKEFSVWVDFGKFISDIKFDAPEGFGVEDVEEYIYNLRDEGWKIYQKAKPKNREGGRDNYQNKGGRNRGHYND